MAARREERRGDLKRRGDEWGRRGLGIGFWGRSLNPREGDGKKNILVFHASRHNGWHRSELGMGRNLGRELGLAV